MLACKRLRIDPCDGSPVVDYRIENGIVESRTLEMAAEGGAKTDERWQRLTSEQLSSHVLANTVVAQWLLRRMGVHRLIRACNPSADNEVHEGSERIAAWRFALGIQRLGNADLRRPLQSPFYDVPCANPIQFLAQHPDYF